MKKGIYFDSQIEIVAAKNRNIHLIGNYDLSIYFKHISLGGLSLHTKIVANFKNFDTNTEL